jgi:hypothetical protein
LEKAERFGGVGLLGVPTFDFFVWALDNYARGELLMNLREQLPSWLLNPAFVFLCMCGGLALLYLSHQQQLRRILARPSPLIDVEQYRGMERPGWLVPLLWVSLGALVAAPVLALAYSLLYKGTTPPLYSSLQPPSICKTADCFPPRPKPTGKIAPSVINSPTCPGGVCAGHDVNGPVTVNPPVNPNAWTTTYNCTGDEKDQGQGASTTFVMSTNFGKELPTLQKMEALNNAKDFFGMIALCEEKMKSVPEWLTPMLFCSLGYASIGNTDKAKELLAEYDKRKGPAYAGEPCKEVSDHLHAHL